MSSSWAKPTEFRIVCEPIQPNVSHAPPTLDRCSSDADILRIIRSAYGCLHTHTHKHTTLHFIVVRFGCARKHHETKFQLKQPATMMRGTSAGAAGPCRVAIRGESPRWCTFYFHVRAKIRTLSNTSDFTAAIRDRRPMRTRRWSRMARVFKNSNHAI